MKATFPGNGAEVRVITAAETMPLRQAVLRPGRAIESAQFPGDDNPEVVHLGAYHEGKLQAVASLFPAELPERPGISAWQLRGMATAPEARGMGLGTALLQACIGHAREKGVGLLWCNARSSALEFYRKSGFEVLGGEFQIPDVGPHFRMGLRVFKPERPA